MRVTAEAARRFLVARHLLAPARTCNGGVEAVLEVFRRLVMHSGDAYDGFFDSLSTFYDDVSGDPERKGR